MGDARRTGISDITGKMVVIRHAGERDRIIVERYLADLGGTSELSGSDVAVAAENERIIGFGILKREKGGGCVSLFEDSRRKGIGSTILRHLVNAASLDKVYAAHTATYFTSSRAFPARASRKGRPGRQRYLCSVPLMERIPVVA